MRCRWAMSWSSFPGLQLEDVLAVVRLTNVIADLGGVCSTVHQLSTFVDLKCDCRESSRRNLLLRDSQNGVSLIAWQTLPIDIRVAHIGLVHERKERPT